MPSGDSHHNNANSGLSDPDHRSARESIRHDSHLALGCGFSVALLVVAALVILLLTG